MSLLHQFFVREASPAYNNYVYLVNVCQWFVGLSWQARADHRAAWCSFSCTRTDLVCPAVVQLDPFPLRVGDVLHPVLPLVRGRFTRLIETGSKNKLYVPPEYGQQIFELNRNGQYQGCIDPLIRP